MSVQMRALSIVVVSPHDGCGATIEETLTQRGHAVVHHSGIAGMFPYLRDAQPDLLILALSPASRREHWRLLEQLYWDPSISTRVLTIVDPALPLQDLAVLRSQVADLPLLFDLDELEAAIGMGAASRERFPIEPLPRLASLFASGFGL
jgi:hypothetical protein